MWDTLKTSIAQYYQDGILNVNEDLYWNGANNVVCPQPAQFGADGNIQERYCCVGLPYSTTTKSMVIQKPNATPPESNYFEFLNVYAPGSTHMPNALRNTTLDAASYTGQELGFVEVDGELDQVIDFPIVDVNNNVLVNRNDAQHPLGGVMGSIAGDVENVQLHYENVNIEITNLPHRTYNGCSRTLDKTIYQAPQSSASTIGDDNLDIVDIIPPTKVWVSLNNPGEIPLNKLDVQLSDEAGVKLSQLEYKQETNLVLEIKGEKEFLN